jgi:hypothetical protein
VKAECEADAVSCNLFCCFYPFPCDFFGYRLLPCSLLCFERFSRPFFFIPVLLPGLSSFSLRATFASSCYAFHRLFFSLHFSSFSFRPYDLSHVFLASNHRLRISFLSLFTAQTYTDPSIFHIRRFIVSAPNYNYVSARFPPDRVDGPDVVGDWRAQSDLARRSVAYCSICFIVMKTVIPYSAGCLWQLLITAMYWIYSRKLHSHCALPTILAYCLPRTCSLYVVTIEWEAVSCRLLLFRLCFASF